MGLQDSRGVAWLTAWILLGFRSGEWVLHTEEFWRETWEGAARYGELIGNQEGSRKRGVSCYEKSNFFQEGHGCSVGAWGWLVW